jgi:hypothetical protein
MKIESQKCLKVRVGEAHDPCEWELFAPDGTPIEGWHLISVGRDHSGRSSLHEVFHTCAMLRATNGCQSHLS